MNPQSKMGIDRCGSPIELMLARELAGLSRFEWRSTESHEWEIGTWPGWWLTLLAQPQFGPYRPDFAILSHFGDDVEGEKPPFGVIIEADGHAFHERTKAQARHDKARDRYLTTLGFSVLRYTGSEIHADARGCAYEALMFAIGMQEANIMPHMTAWITKRFSERRTEP